jgi:hypothetical protein
MSGPPASRRSPDSQTAPPRVGRLRRRRATALLAPRPSPSGIGMTKPTIQQARDRAEVVSGATRPEWVTSAGSLERVNRRPKRARECLQDQECGSRTRLSNLGNGSISAARIPMIGWLLLALMRRVSRSNKWLLVGLKQTQRGNGGCACRKSNSHIQMMKSAEKWRRQNATNGMYCSRRRRVLVD